MFGWDINIRYNMLNSVKSNKVFTFHPFDCCFLKYLLFIKGINRTESWSPIYEMRISVSPCSNQEQLPGEVLCCGGG